MITMQHANDFLISAGVGFFSVLIVHSVIRGIFRK